MPLLQTCVVYSISKYWWKNIDRNDKFQRNESCILGFYGRPWNTHQRLELFSRMKEFGMNTYLYAPKDDVKHRAYWRDLYTVEESGRHLFTSLIDIMTMYSIFWVLLILVL